MIKLFSHLGSNACDDVSFFKDLYLFHSDIYDWIVVWQGLTLGDSYIYSFNQSMLWILIFLFFQVQRQYFIFLQPFRLLMLQTILEYTSLVIYCRYSTCMYLKKVFHQQLMVMPHQHLLLQVMFLFPYSLLGFFFN